MKYLLLLLFSSSLWAYDYNDRNVTVDLHNNFLNETFDFELSLFDNTKCIGMEKINNDLDQETFKQVEIDLNNLRNDVIQCEEAPEYAKYYLNEYVKLEKHFVSQNNVLKNYIQDKYKSHKVEQFDNFVPKFWSNLSSASMTLHKVRLSLDVLNDADNIALPECLVIVKKKNINEKYCSPICKLTAEKRLKYLKALQQLKPLVELYWKKSWCQALLDKLKFEKVKKEAVFKVVNQKGENSDYFYNGAVPSLYKGGAEPLKEENKEKLTPTPEPTITMPTYKSKQSKSPSNYYFLTRESYYNRLRLLEREDDQGDQSIWKTISERYYKGFYPQFIKENSNDSLESGTTE